jgi:xanthine dehydrogenase YagS FAD-binding subunit
MKSFEYYRPVNVGQVLSLLAKHKENAAILAGGSDLLGMMKDKIEGPKLKLPRYLIDIKEIKELSYIKQEKAGLKIGATTTIAEIASSDLVAKSFPILVQAARQVAVPQIRNVGTLGGNLCQRPRCWYFRRKIFDDCLRKGGNDCYTVSGENMYHAILGGENCYMVCPSDMAPALVALNARLEIATPKGKKMVSAEQFYIGPAKSILRETLLTSQDMLISVEIPCASATAKGVYLKLKERQSFDFAIASVAAQITFKGSTVADSRIVFGGLAPVPLRREKAEGILKGKEIKEGFAACCKTALEGAQPLSQNAYKIDAAKGLLEEALGLLA